MATKPKRLVMLTPEHEQVARDKLRLLHDLIPECDRAEDCGVSMTEHREMIATLQEQLQAIIDNFCPGGKCQRKRQA